MSKVSVKVGASVSIDGKQSVWETLSVEDDTDLTVDELHEILVNDLFEKLGEMVVKFKVNFD